MDNWLSVTTAPELSEFAVSERSYANLRGLPATGGEYCEDTDLNSVGSTTIIRMKRGMVGHWRLKGSAQFGEVVSAWVRDFLQTGLHGFRDRNLVDITTSSVAPFSMIFGRVGKLEIGRQNLKNQHVKATQISGGNNTPHWCGVRTNIHQIRS